MPEGLGMQGYLGLAFQLGVGSLQCGSVHWLPIINETITKDIALLESAAIRGGSFDPINPKQGLRTIGGDVVFNPDPMTVAVLAHAAFGFTAATSAAQSHIFTAAPTNSVFSARAPLQPFTLLVARDVGTTIWYHDLYANRLSLNVRAGELVGVTLSVVGGGYTTVATTITTSYTGRSVRLPAAFNEVTMQVAGATVDYFRDFTVNLNNNLEAYATLTTTNAPTRCKRTAHRKVDFSATVEFENLTEYDKWRARTGQALTMAVNSTGSPFGYFILTLARAQWDTFPPNISDAGPIRGSVTGRGEFDDTTGQFGTLVTYNTSNTGISPHGWTAIGNGSMT